MKQIVLFYPFVPEEPIKNVSEVLRSRWIGQGPRVNEFEQRFKDRFATKSHCVAVGSGTDALHLAYICAGLKPGDEVIAPVFTCTATNIPFLYMGVKIRFADVDPKTLNINVEHVKNIISEKTKAIICVHYGGLPCDMHSLNSIGEEYGIPIIQDSAHAIGAKYKGKDIADLSEFSCFSFQAIKSITTGDGGMLIINDKTMVEKAKRIRWFGIDRIKKQKGIWENDIFEIGYKYQMTDIAAAMGLSSLGFFEQQLNHRRELLLQYQNRLKTIPGIEFINNNDEDYYHAAWLCTILAQNRLGLEKKLKESNIESNQVHYRNDRYSIFSMFSKSDLPNMNYVENKYLVLPMHSKVSLEDVDRICNVINSGW